MTRTRRTILFLGSALAMAMAPALLNAQNFDASGTVNLKGQYLFRYVNFFNDASGNLTESCTLSGTITFDGAGKYTLSNTHLADSSGAAGTGYCTSLGGGTYGVQSNGIAQLDNPLYPATLFGSFTYPVVIASSTEDDYFDLFIAVQAPASSASNSLLNGAYTVGMLDFPNADAARARQGYFTLNADGNGNIAAFTVNGSAENVSGGATITQDVAASTYALSGAAGGTATFPGSSTSLAGIIGGEKLLYVSADGNWFVGGAVNGSDMVFGFRAPAGTSSNSLLTGTYFTAGMEDGQPGSFNSLDAFYGSVNANGSGVLIRHERFDDVAGLSTYDKTFNTQLTLGAGGSYYDGSTYTYLAGSNGAALMLIGSNQQFSLIIAIQTQALQAPASAWINPVGITDAANYTPITNSFAPGELVSLYGSYGVSTQVASTLPISTTLGGVQVFVNGQAAPVYLVSQNQIDVFIPYEIAGDSFATFQAVVNGQKSNPVTVYVDNSAPGIYTLSENGIGAGAILHTDYSEVNTSNPAKPGETVIMFMNGLGPVTPGIPDGAAAPTSPVSTSTESNSIFMGLDDGTNLAFAETSFAGLAPGFAGLYQVNFKLPSSGLQNGDVRIQFSTIEGQNEMASISVAGFSQTPAFDVPASHAARLRSRIAARAVHGKYGNASGRARRIADPTPPRF